MADPGGQQGCRVTVLMSHLLKQSLWRSLGLRRIGLPGRDSGGSEEGCWSFAESAEVLVVLL